jgi:phage FluMu protein Com
MFCEGSGVKDYDMLPRIPGVPDGKMKCPICGLIRSPRLHHRNRRNETYVQAIFTMPTHERRGKIERYCPNPDCNAKLRLDLDKIILNAKCPKCGLIFKFFGAGEEPTLEIHRDIMRHIIKTKGGRL